MCLFDMICRVSSYVKLKSAGGAYNVISMRPLALIMINIDVRFWDVFACALFVFVLVWCIELHMYFGVSSKLRLWFFNRWLLSSLLTMLWSDRFSNSLVCLNLNILLRGIYSVKKIDWWWFSACWFRKMHRFAYLPIQSMHQCTVHAVFCIILEI